MQHSTLDMCSLKAQIKEDKQRAQEAQVAQEATQQSGINRIAGIEAAMEVEQATQATGKVKPVRPCARPVKKKTDGKGASSDLTSESLPVPATQAKGQGAGNSEAVGSKAAARPPKKKKASMGRHLIATRKEILYQSTLHFMTLTWSLRGKKFGLTGKINNWRNHVKPEAKSKASPVAKPETEFSGVSVLKAKASLKSVVQIAKSSDDSEMPGALVPIPFNLLPYSQQADIVRFALEQAQPRRVSSTKRTIDEAELIESSEEFVSDCNEDAAEEDTDCRDTFKCDIDPMLLDEEPISAKVEQVPKPMRTTTKTSVTVAEKLNPPKKAKLEPVLSTSSEPNLMAADMSTKPKTGSQWRNTDLPPIMLEGGAWRQRFIPTVFLWAGAQPKFWSIETEKLLPALQAIFDISFPGINHNIQPKGPIIGLVNQRICSWRSNFGSTAIALVTSFLAASRDDENDDDDDGAEYEQGLATFLLENWAFLYEDPETCDADKIYRSVFMLELIESAHINMIAGFLDVLALDTDALQLKGMQAVIAASAAALERAFNFTAKPKVLKQNNTGSKESTAISAFSEANCGSATSEYYKSLKRRGVKYTADTIALVREHQEAAKKLKSAPTEELKPKGERALLYCFPSPFFALLDYLF
ncbi:hypothetical protein F4604DRAFT_1675058 [Suillus subluteus]|nr:hypothetical protein F4604DRAFT_1675058 [Suillus subluteus]